MGDSGCTGLQIIAKRAGLHRLLSWKGYAVTIQPSESETDGDTGTH